MKSLFKILNFYFILVIIPALYLSIFIISGSDVRASAPTDPCSKQLPITIKGVPVPSTFIPNLNNRLGTTTVFDNDNSLKYILGQQNTFEMAGQNDFIDIESMDTVQVTYPYNATTSSGNSTVYGNGDNFDWGSATMLNGSKNAIITNIFSKESPFDVLKKANTSYSLSQDISNSALNKYIYNISPSYRNSSSVDTLTSDGMMKMSFSANYSENFPIGQPGSSVVCNSGFTIGYHINPSINYNPLVFNSYQSVNDSKFDIDYSPVSQITKHFISQSDVSTVTTYVTAPTNLASLSPSGIDSYSTLNETHLASGCVNISDPSTDSSGNKLYIVTPKNLVTQRGYGMTTVGLDLKYYANKTGYSWDGNRFWFYKNGKFADTHYECNPPVNTIKIVRKFSDNPSQDLGVSVSLTKSGSNITSGPGSPTFVQNAGVIYNGISTGDYKIQQNTYPNYTASYTGECDVNGVVHIVNPGDFKTCTILNTANPTGVKVITNVVGGTKTPSDFMVHVKYNTYPNQDVAGSPRKGSSSTAKADENLTFFNLTAGNDYKVTVDPQTNYITTYSPDCNYFYQNDYQINNCTITNTYNAPAAILNITNTDTRSGLTNSVDFTNHIKISGSSNDFSSGHGGQYTLPAGSYVISESSSTLSDFSDYITAFSGGCDLVGKVTLNPGETKSCTIANSYKPFTLNGKIYVTDEINTIKMMDLPTIYRQFIDATSSYNYLYTPCIIDQSKNRAVISSDSSYVLNNITTNMTDCFIQSHVVISPNEYPSSSSWDPFNGHDKFDVKSKVYSFTPVINSTNAQDVCIDIRNPNNYSPTPPINGGQPTPLNLKDNSIADQTKLITLTTPNACLPYKADAKLNVSVEFKGFGANPPNNYHIVIDPQTIDNSFLKADQVAAGDFSKTFLNLLPGLYKVTVNDPTNPNYYYNNPDYKVIYTGNCDGNGLVNLSHNSNLNCNITVAYKTADLIITTKVSGTGPAIPQDFTIDVSGISKSGGKDVDYPYTSKLINNITITSPDTKGNGYTASFAGYGCSKVGDLAGTVDLTSGDRKCMITMKAPTVIVPVPTNNTNNLNYGVGSRGW